MPRGGQTENRGEVDLISSWMQRCNLGAHPWLALSPPRSPIVRHNKKCSAKVKNEKLSEPKSKAFFALLTSDVAPAVLSYLSICDTTRLLTICKTLADAQGDFPWMLSAMRLHIAQETRVSRISLVHCSRGGHLGLGRGFSAMARALLALPSSYEVSDPSADREDPGETRPCDALCGACNTKLRVTLAPGVCGATGLQNAFGLPPHSWADPSATARVVCTSTSCPLQPHLLIQAEHCEGLDNTCETLSLRVCDFCNFRTQRCTSCAIECDDCSSIICEDCLCITQSESQLCPNCSFRCGGCEDCFEREGCNSCSSCGEESGEEFCDQCWNGGVCCVCDETKCMDCAVFADCAHCGERTCADCIRTSLCSECNDPVCPAPGCGAHFG